MTGTDRKRGTHCARRATCGCYASWQSCGSLIVSRQRSSPDSALLRARMPASWRSPAPGYFRRFFLGEREMPLCAFGERGAESPGYRSVVRVARLMKRSSRISSLSTSWQSTTLYCALKCGVVPVAGVRPSSLAGVPGVDHKEHLRLIPDGYVEFVTPVREPLRGISRSRSRTRTGTRVEGEVAELRATRTLRRLRTALRY